MYWNDAKAALLKLPVGTDINTENSSCRFLLAKESNGIRVCVYNGERGILLDFPFLEKCYYALTAQEGFNAKFLRTLCEKRYLNKPCIMHATGQLFVKACIATLDHNGHTYFLRKGGN